MRERTERPATPNRRRTASIGKRYRRLAVVAVLVTGSALLAIGRADALPPGAPRIGMVCSPGTVSGSTHTFNLVAKTGYIDDPGRQQHLHVELRERRRAGQRSVPELPDQSCA